MIIKITFALTSELSLFQRSKQHVLKIKYKKATLNKQTIK